MDGPAMDRGAVPDAHGVVFISGPSHATGRNLHRPARDLPAAPAVAVIARPLARGGRGSDMARDRGRNPYGDGRPALDAFNKGDADSVVLTGPAHATGRNLFPPRDDAAPDEGPTAEAEADMADEDLPPASPRP